jgi:hypothetical protein
MQQIKGHPSVKRRNRLVMVVVVAIMAALFIGGFSLIILK